MKSINNIRLGKIIEKLIENEPGLTLTRLADEVGANRNALDNIVTANAIPRGLKTVIKIADRFGLSLDQVVFGHLETKDSLPVTESKASVSETIEILVEHPIKIQFVSTRDKGEKP